MPRRGLLVLPRPRFASSRPSRGGVRGSKGHSGRLLGLLKSIRDSSFSCLLIIQHTDGSQWFHTPVLWGIVSVSFLSGFDSRSPPQKVQGPLVALIPLWLPLYRLEGCWFPSRLDTTLSSAPPRTRVTDITLWACGCLTP